MQFKTFINAVALAVFAASVHAKVPAGTYTIMNGGATIPLAITFNGEGETLTVTDLNIATEHQKWVVKDYGVKTQSISPACDDKLQCAWGDNVVNVLPAGGYVWTITESSHGPTTYTIQDGGETVYWGVASGDNGSIDNGAVVTIGEGSAEEYKNIWIFTPTVEL